LHNANTEPRHRRLGELHVLSQHLTDVLRQPDILKGPILAWLLFNERQNRSSMEAISQRVMEHNLFSFSGLE